MEDVRGQIGHCAILQAVEGVYDRWVRVLRLQDACGLGERFVSGGQARGDGTGPSSENPGRNAEETRGNRVDQGASRAVRGKAPFIGRLTYLCFRVENE